MNFKHWCSLLCLVSIVGCTQDSRTVMHMTADLEAHGRFAEADTHLERAALSASPSDSLRYEQERERIRRIRLDYGHTDTSLFRDLTRRLQDLTWHEFTAWIEEGRFDTRRIDDTLRFFDLSGANLFWRFPQLNARRRHPPADSVYEHRLLATIRQITAEAERRGTTRVLPRQFTTRMEVTVDSGIVPVGETLRAWLPVPRAYPHQRDIVVLGSTPPVVTVAPPDAPLRSAYFEYRVSASGPQTVEILYRFTADGVRFPMRAEDILPYAEDDPVVLQFTAEAPQVRFTPALRRASRTILGEGEPNPLVRARQIYNWITENFRYSYAEEYSTLRNIPEYCLQRRRGDCGQIALLFITLCRMNGIPARWQSGWWIFPGSKTIHDWAEIYLNPYGWVPVDPDLGMESLRYHTSLTWSERGEIRAFFFGGLDQYRIAANADHAQPLTPAKHTWRSDDVDFQRGEVEFAGTNVYFDERSYELIVEETGVPH